MKIIPTSELVVEQAKEPMIAWCVVNERGAELSGDEPILLDAEQESPISIKDNGALSVVDGFRCCEEYSLAEWYAKQYTQATNKETEIYQVEIMDGAHLVRHEGVIYCSQFIIYGN